jgi:hypothetical protein
MINKTKCIVKTLLLASVLAAQIALAGCGASQGQRQYSDYSKRSGFTITNVDSVSVENLAVLAKVWGFAKYHHPVFAGETLDADYELFELLPQVAYANKDERNDILLDWAKGLGEFNSEKEKLLKEIAEKGYTSSSDTAWLDDTELLGAELSTLLQDMRYAERFKSSRYAKMTYGGHINFDKESSAELAKEDDAGYNLLTLFRLWNMAEYYFPSVNITDRKWSEVLTKYIPKFLSGENYTWTTAELITELSDTHSTMRRPDPIPTIGAPNPIPNTPPPNPIYNDMLVPVALGLVEDKLIVTDSRKYSVASPESIFQTGDEIVSIEGRSAEQLFELARKYISVSNERALLRNAPLAARSVTNIMTPASVVVRRDNELVELNVPTIGWNEDINLQMEWDKARTYYSLMENGSVGYLFAGKFKNSGGSEIMKTFADTKAIVIDLRCYPNEPMPFSFVGRYLVPDRVQHVTFTKTVAELPGYFKEEPASLGIRNDKYYKGKIVVLVNEQSISQAEYTAMAFQTVPDCVVVGSQTAGADGNVVSLPLPRNIKTWFSGIGVFYPDGTNTQRTGVRIDHYVTPTIEGIRAGRDEVLERALEIIDGKH